MKIRINSTVDSPRSFNPLFKAGLIYKANVDPKQKKWGRLGKNNITINTVVAISKNGEKQVINRKTTPFDILDCPQKEYDQIINILQGLKDDKQDKLNEIAEKRAIRAAIPAGCVKGFAPRDGFIFIDNYKDAVKIPGALKCAMGKTTTIDNKCGRPATFVKIIPRKGKSNIYILNCQKCACIKSK